MHIMSVCYTYLFEFLHITQNYEIFSTFFKIRAFVSFVLFVFLFFGSVFIFMGFCVCVVL